ncbi:adenylate/guanylate cyclase domain-containing protein [Dongia deserti]|uniref:adenylate/guanylate cyclase domain-containing protein n=1 Tax=Dongia deserti TaxID=2268030 RepID=UPI000E654408|nr:adenylate/guanylate cyclase domain-containing protein [Dongia deserti]
MTMHLMRDSFAKRRLRVPIWVVLVLVLGGMTSVMAVVIGVRFYVAGLVSTTQLVEDLGRSSLAQLTEMIESQLQPAADQSKFLADILSRDQVDPKNNQRLQDLLLGSLAAVRQLRAVAYVGLDHRLVWAGQNENGRGYSAKVTHVTDETQVPALLAEATRRRAQFWSRPIQFDWETGPLLIAVAPVFRQGDVIGIIGAAVSTRAASERLARLSGVSGLVPFVLTPDGHILMHGSTAKDVPPGREWRDGAILADRQEFPDPVLAAMQWPPSAGAADQHRDAPQTGLHMERVALPDGTHFVIHRRLTGYGPDAWFVGYHLPETWVAQSYATINRAIPFALIVLLIALGLAYWLGRSIARPMIVLSQSGQRLARLDFTPLEIKSSLIKEVERAVEAQRAMRNGLQWLSNYIPRSLTPLLMKSGEELISRERDIVVLFTDIVGFSQIAEGRPAAKVAALLNRHFGLLGAIIDQEGGTIDKYIGDSIMAFWGAPLDQEDRAERAVRAAQRVARKLQADNERRARKGLKPIRIRIGIHRGPALVGNIGAPGRVNYTLVGDTVNVAQRLEQFAREVDDGVSDAVIVISGELASVLPPGVALIDVGDQLFHGRSTATRVFRMPMG